VDPDFARHYYEAANPDHWWFRGRSTIVERLLSAHGLTSGTALDVGAGRTTLIPESFETFRLDLVVPQPRGSGPFVRGSALHLPFRESTFDVVGLFDLIEHVTDEASLLANTRGVLKPGGIVVATVPAHQWLWSSHDVQAAHVRRYSQKELQAIFRASRFRVVQCRQFYGFLLIPALVRKTLRLHQGIGAPAPVVNSALTFLAKRSAISAMRRSRWGLSIALLATVD
jgi:SAM-dependent methyltransferase